MFYRVFHHHGRSPDVFELDDDAIAYHLPHYRQTGAFLGTLDNINYVARKHPRYDFEAMHSPGSLGDLLARAHPLREPSPPPARAGLGQPRRAAGGRDGPVGHQPGPGDRLRHLTVGPRRGSTHVRP